MKCFLAFARICKCAPLLRLEIVRALNNKNQSHFVCYLFGHFYMICSNPNGMQTY